VEIDAEVFFRSTRFDFGPRPAPELDGFRAATRLGPAGRRNQIKVGGRKDHHVYFWNWSAAVFVVSVTATPDNPPLGYIKEPDPKKWQLNKLEVPKTRKFLEPSRAKATDLVHDGSACRAGNQYIVVLKGEFEPALPGSPKHMGDVTITLRCT
jgi:hypothetical protein